MTTKTKTQTKSSPTMTPKQAQVKVTNLLKGIDNSNVVINKKQEDLKRQVDELKSVMPIALTQPDAPVQAAPAKSAPKPAGSGKPAAQAKPKAKAETKPKPEAKAKAANGTAKPGTAKAKAAAKPSLKAPAGERPLLKQVIHDIIAKGGNHPMTKPDLYNTAIAKFGKWSRQSFYNAIKDTKHFKAVGDGFVNVPAAARSASASNGHGDKDEADRFVEQVEMNQGTSAVV